jgi:glutamate carboxypeptidase
MAIKSLQPILDGIKSNYAEMIDLLERWVNINSHSENLKGLEEMNSALIDAFGKLGGEVREIDLEHRTVFNEKGELHSIPSAKALHIQKHPGSPIKLFFCGHMDTVHSPLSHFQKASKHQDIMKGPGVADMKGGACYHALYFKSLRKQHLPRQNWLGSPHHS